MTPADPGDSAATAAQVEVFIDRFTSEIADRVRAARTVLRSRLPGATELVYDNYNALAIGYGPGDKTSEAVFSLAIYPRNILLYFLPGVGLPDPEGLLQGEGKVGRYVCLKNVALLDEPAVIALIDAALDRAKRPLPPQGGRTIVKSISARQRPRRPGEAA
ncbi:DUF1801 domain-containing protein [Sphingomonas sp. NIBR02145]|uniref:DUF1801 domain-containing protein n=1 Tax=Sphingomonas sp. NIBR02145 TaxID=3014784 RepID=UPI0022B3704B|nr:DUF1801 domain-containing protein [Sphingomonas sp. NIBR02145]WHU04013.1 DUF1801 domain-containing protein [Sphingomonas sp. NIBR02145]